MPGQINVDTTNETAEVQFLDDHQERTDPPADVTVAFASDNEAVVTVAADPDNALIAKITPVAEGVATISADISGALEPSGEPFTVDPQLVTVSPGPAATAELVLSV